jgi:hypothetical protein
MSGTPYRTTGRSTPLPTDRVGGPDALVKATLLTVLGVVIGASPAVADICIQRPLCVRQLQGIAVSKNPAGDEALPGVQIRIERRDGRQTPLTATTDAEGRFSVPSLAPGHYFLTAVAEPLDEIRIPLVVRRSWFWQGRDTRETVFRFRFDRRTLCGGSTVERRKRVTTSSTR